MSSHTDRKVKATKTVASGARSVARAKAKSKAAPGATPATRRGKIASARTKSNVALTVKALTVKALRGKGAKTAASARNADQTGKSGQKRKAGASGQTGKSGKVAPRSSALGLAKAKVASKRVPASKAAKPKAQSITISTAKSARTSSSTGRTMTEPKQAATAVVSATKAGVSNPGATKAGVTKAGGRGNGTATGAARSEIVLAAGYRPSEAEPFMNERHRTYFRNKLVAWKEDIVRQNRETLVGLHEDSTQHADLADRATSETDRALELRARDRQRKLVAKIDAALARIEEGTYGYCEETGEPINLKRLDARPIATMSLEAQERHERRERVFRED